MQYFRLFYKDTSKRALNSHAFGRKTQLVGEILRDFNENSIEKLNFYLFLWNSVARIERSEIRSFFYNKLFQFWGVEPPNPTDTPLIELYSIALPFLDLKSCACR